MRWMLDTDTCIGLIKRHPGAIRKLRGKSIGQVGISSITLAELAFGVGKSSKRQEAEAALGEFLLALEVASFGESAALHYGGVRALLERRGKPIRPLDTLIAAHALAEDVILVTHDSTEFQRVEGLRTEDWLAK